MSDEKSGRIIEWDKRRSFGFVHDGTNRVFLHEREFVKPHKVPERGDIITFFVGTDATGRIVAKEVRIREARAGLEGIHFAALALLLVGPGFAIHRLSAVIDYRITVGVAAALSLLTLWIYAIDKRRAQEGEYRVPEKVLHGLELIGGWPGAFLGQRKFRHKSAKPAFLLIFWLIVGAHQYLAADYALNWRLSAAIKSALQRPEPARPAAQ